MIYISEHSNYGLAYMTIPVRYTCAQGWEFSWRQALTEDMDFKKNIGFFSKIRNKKYKNKCNHLKRDKPRKRKYRTMKRATKKKEENIKFAKGVSIIE